MDSATSTAPTHTVYAGGHGAVDMWMRAGGDWRQEPVLDLPDFESVSSSPILTGVSHDPFLGVVTDTVIENTGPEGWV